MAIEITNRFEAIDDWMCFAKGERCTQSEYNLVLPHEFSTCVVFRDNGEEVVMYLRDFQKHFKAVSEREEAKDDFNTVLEEAIKQQNVQEELDNIAKRLGELELEKQELLKKAKELEKL